MPRTQPGIAVFDTSCIKHLRDPTIRSRIAADCRVADWQIWMSTINVLEATKTSNASVRDVLLNTIGALQDGRPLLPWPFELIKRVGEAVARGEPAFHMGAAGVEWIIDSSRPAPSEDDVQKATVAMQSLENDFTEMHDDARTSLQAFLKNRDLRRYWTSAQDFLDQQWSTKDHLADYVTGIWSRLELPGDAPVDKMLENETWRIFLEVNGFAAFERAIEVNPPKRVQYVDLLQLVYVTGSRRRMLVSADKGFLRAAAAILVGRYPRVRVLSWDEFADC